MDRTLPHNLEAEKALLGAVLINPKAWPMAATIVRAEDFFRDAHAKLFTACGVLVQAGTTIDLVTLTNECNRVGQLNDVGGPGYISGLTDGVPHSANVEHYAKIVREKASLRSLIQRANDTLARAYDAEDAAADIVDRAMREIGSVALSSSGSMVRAKEAVAEYGAELSSGTLPQPVPTGFTDLDQLVHGIRPGQFAIVAGRPSSGKTSMTLGMADQMAVAGHPTCMFSLEMHQTEIAAQLLTRWSGVQAVEVERGTATEDDYSKVVTALSGLDERPLYLETASRTITEVWAWCERLKRERGLEVAIIDYLQLLCGSEEAEVAAVSRAMKLMARELKIGVVALSQLRRAPDGKADKRPHLSDLRGSGALEQDTDLALLIYRAEMHKELDDDNPNKGVAEIIVAKNRRGSTGMVKLAFVAKYAKFADLYREPKTP